MKIKAEAINSRDLKAGDLFSVAGPEHWNQFGKVPFCVGEKVYIHTGQPQRDSKHENVYRITIVHDDAR